MTRLALVSTVAVALVAAGAAGAGRVAALAGVPGLGNAKAVLPGGWSHAEINVIVRRVPHTVVYDRGRVVSVSGQSLTLRERDGSLWTIDVAPNAVVMVAGRPGTLAQVVRFEIVTTIRVDGGPAIRVRVQPTPRSAAASPATGAPPATTTG